MEYVPPHRISLKSEDGESIQIARSLLDHSLVFKDLLNDENLNVLNISENYQRLLQMKRYLENGDPELSSLQDAYELYKMSKKFRMNSILMSSRIFLNDRINSNDVCEIYEFACEQEDRRLQYRCWIWFDDYCNAVLTSKGFLRCKTITIDTFVSRPKYKYLKEVELFYNIVLWAEKRFEYEENSSDINYRNMKIRCYLLPFLNRIRFLSMTSTELNFVFMQNILLPDEKESISKSRDVPDLHIHPNLCPIRIKRTKQCYRPLIDYKHRRQFKTKINARLRENCKFFCCFIAKEDCFLTGIVIPICHLMEGTKIRAKVKCIIGNSIQEDDYYCERNGEVHIPYPMFIPKNVEVFIKAVPNLQNIGFVGTIKIAQNPAIYIDDNLFNELCEENINWLEWREYYIKVRLYF
ncbi:uncharacterized protein LOC111618548 isoform X2 [Centruroides sculpturatus]|uniref:uncharacterized protein LOC111618548 isoform X2 n=1 Tax=Centruroides sculpturatus TaxID=218467 RepID=UPI000C6D1B74|nr:uncharacterized protein LOC111618548 isoform X2 [Centruroides sculpturatus]